jgi:dTMP kinase
MSSRGRFIVFEGIDGSGKSTQSRRLAASLATLGRRVHLTSEPTNGPIGSVLRLGLTKRLSLDSRTLAHLYAADRCDHLHNPMNGIIMSLDSGIDVVCDRYVLSSFAYQSPNVPFEFVELLNRNFPFPDLTVFLRTDPQKALTLKARESAYRDSTETVDKQTMVALQYESALNYFVNQLAVLTVDTRTIGEEETARKVFERAKELVDAK